MAMFTEWQIIDSSGYFVRGGVEPGKYEAEKAACAAMSGLFRPGYRLYIKECPLLDTPGKLRRV